MLAKINKIAFALIITSLLLTIINMFSQFYKTNILWTHPLFITFILSLISLELGLLGFGGVENRIGLVRSITTTILSILLIIILGFILLSGILFS